LGWGANQQRKPWSAKGAVITAAGVLLLAAVAFGVSREVITSGHAPSAAPSQSAAGAVRAVPPPKPAFTSAEEKYIQALWPVHGDVERSALRVSLGNILYKTGELDAAALKARVESALASYRGARARMLALEPPPSLGREHDDYLAAIALFERAALEELKMFEDGDGGHLLVAYPLSKQGGDKIREIGSRFWKDEFTAH
jgi:hypothetical protein